MYTELNEQFKITKTEFDNLKSRENISIECHYCKDIYYRTKHDVQSTYRKNITGLFFCSFKCLGAYKSSLNTFIVECKNCDVSIKKQNSDKNESGNYFCNHSCAASFLNKNRSIETRKKLSDTHKALAKRKYYSIKYFKFIYPLQINLNIKITKSNYNVNINKIKKDKKVYSYSYKILNKKIYTSSCVICDSVILSKNKNKLCSHECYMKNAYNNFLKNPHIAKNRNKKESYLEKSFREYIESNGYIKDINYSQDKFFKFEIENDNKKAYFADFYFPHINTIFELDGSQHKYTIEYDTLRDKRFADNGIKTIRISHKEWREKSKVDLINNILSIQ